MAITAEQTGGSEAMRSSNVLRGTAGRGHSALTTSLRPDTAKTRLARRMQTVRMAAGLPFRQS